jgi:hypothetical protein
VPLTELSQFCGYLSEQEEPNFIELMILQGRLPREITKVEDLNTFELKKLEAVKLEYKREVLYNWPRTIFSALEPYKKPYLINGKQLAEYIKSGADLIATPVYCGVFLMKAGRLYSVVRHNGKAYVQKDLVSIRSEDV